MSTIHPVSNDRDRRDGYVDHNEMSPRERFLGHIVVMLICLLAILLRSM